ncbi:hypothetical protein BAG01nite_14600 [Brevibacillus agri]|uniref:Core domain-containing protein n=1 Tax=Brevibacillus agri TaxID=51101 RepID=A0A3M8B467_9BACL|nr:MULTISPECIES: iron-sulfur cluster biosynthesis family protein [Brevibacillus]MBY0051380.1 hypothetical protein [Brevibacillus agri]MCG5249725.1 hypothetical protein [Brevibacillus agri]MDN4091911.1 iron-sulfur cluster biosynthesis family protein [Brevibacillus agri]MDR9506520.1 iron-sulfur cluster biosynthesis family protein [Brevibacillus agri]MED1643229.1 iron-sulfur cluster biosynthesis family protein [Brevibacillus agri]
MITITPQAAARLALMIAEERDADKLGIRLVPTTTGCGSFTYSIAITEAEKHDQVQVINEVRFFYQPQDVDKLLGTVIDCDPVTGRFSILHPRPQEANCPHTH